MNTEALFLKFSEEKLRQLMERIDACLLKLTDQQIWARGGSNENAVGNLVLHLAGNVRQWVVSSVGENPVPRDRDAEFDTRGGFTAAELSARLRSVVDEACAVIADLNEERLTRIYEIQTYRVSGLEAVYHVVEHFAMHTGQIIFVTKMVTGGDLGFYGHLRSSVVSEQAP